MDLSIELHIYAPGVVQDRLICAQFFSVVCYTTTSSNGSEDHCTTSNETPVWDRQVQELKAGSLCHE